MHVKLNRVSLLSFALALLFAPLSFFAFLWFIEQLPSDVTIVNIGVSAILWAPPVIFLILGFTLRNLAEVAGNLSYMNANTITEIQKKMDGMQAELDKLRKEAKPD